MRSAPAGSGSGPAAAGPQSPPSETGSAAESVYPLPRIEAYPPLPQRGSGQGAVLLIRLLGIALILSLITLGALSVITLFFQQEVQRSNVFAGPVHQVVTDVAVGDVSVHAADPGQALIIRRTLHWSFQQPASEVTNAAGVVTVTGRCAANAFAFDNCAVDLDIVLPPGTTVALSTTSGDIDVDGASADVTATTRAGNVDLHQLSSPRVKATSSGGDVSVSLVANPRSVQVRTSAGDVRITVPGNGTSYRITARTSVGDRVLRIPNDPAASRTIEAITSMGDISLTLADPAP